MVYDRKIKYLDYLEKGERLRGVGFVKLERREDVCNLNMQVQNLHRTDSFVRRVYLVGEKEEALLGEVSFKEGRGNLALERIDSQNLCGSGISYDRLCALRIPIGKDREILCRIQEGAWPLWSMAEGTEAASEGERKEAAQENAPAEGERGKAAEGVPPREAVPENALSEGERKMAEEGETPREAAQENAPAEGERGKAAEGVPPRKAMPEKAPSEETRREAAQMEGASEEERGKSAHEEAPSERARKESTQENVPSEEARREAAQGETSPKDSGQPVPSEVRMDGILEDKWQQLWAIYPHIRPFEDDREYLSVTPADFVVLQDRSYRLAHNSFLLHGYYNYDHLILGRWEKRGDVRYYIGVPGSFHEKERQVAVMFGFESFECKKEPAHPGDYGYYMIRVDL